MDLLQPILDIGIADRHIGIDGGLFEGLIVADLQGGVIHHVIPPGSHAGIPGIKIGGGGKECIPKQSYCIARAGRSKYRPVDVETLPDSVGTQGKHPMGCRGGSGSCLE